MSYSHNARMLLKEREKYKRSKITFFVMNVINYNRLKNRHFYNDFRIPSDSTFLLSFRYIFRYSKNIYIISLSGCASFRKLPVGRRTQPLHRSKLLKLPIFINNNGYMVNNNNNNILIHALQFNAQTLKQKHSSHYRRRAP